MQEIDLYTTASMSHSGTKDTGKGIGLPQPSPLHTNYKQDAYPPAGWADNWQYPWPNDVWVDSAGYIYFAWGRTQGLGIGLYRFQLNSADPVGMTYDSFVSLPAILTGAFNFSNYIWFGGSCVYDDTDDSVIILGAGIGAGSTPVIGKWLCSSWPFTAGNAVWLSTAVGSWAAYTAGAITNGGIPHLGSNYLYITSYRSGQVHCINKLTGAVVGIWVFSGVYNSTEVYRFMFLGEAGGYPYGGNLNAAAGSGNLYQWDVTNPGVWTTYGAPVFLLGGTNTYARYTVPYRRATDSFDGRDMSAFPLSRFELSALGKPATTIGWWVYSNIRHATLKFYDRESDVYTEAPVYPQEYARVNQQTPLTNPARFVKIDDMPWYISSNFLTLDQEAENPGGPGYRQIGTLGVPLGPGETTFTWTAGESAQPKKLLLSLASDAVDFLRSTHDSKISAQFRVNGGAWSDLRCGKRQLMHLDSIIDSKSVWPSYSISDTLDLKVRLTNGWPYADDGTIQGNPGEIGDPTTPLLSVMDQGPPREVRPILGVDPDEIGGGFG